MSFYGPQPSSSYHPVILYPELLGSMTTFGCGRKENPCVLKSTDLTDHYYINRVIKSRSHKSTIVIWIVYSRGNLLPSAYTILVSWN